MREWTQVHNADVKQAVIDLRQAERSARAQNSQLSIEPLDEYSTRITPKFDRSLRLLRRVLDDTGTPFLTPSSSRWDRVVWWLSERFAN